MTGSSGAMTRPTNAQSLVRVDDIDLVAPLGLRFWDVATQSAAGAGLYVEAHPNATPERATPAAVGPSGIYSFCRLPGLRGFENGAGDEPFWASDAPRVPFTVLTSDPQNRYLPCRLAITLPVKGIYAQRSSPLDSGLVPDASWIPLFTASSRPVPDAMAVIRAQLQDKVSGEAAAWAMVTARAADLAPVTGLADARGSLALPLPYPEPRNFALGSPLGTGGSKLTDQRWPVTISVFYSPGRDRELAPDLEETLRQPPGIAWRDSLHTGEADSFSLQFGRDLTLRSRDVATNRDLSVLLITPGGSPL
jgi:hypothetical protein